MKRSFRKNFGFTLIELLVVVAIIGILASVVLASLNSARAKARDARRLEDMHQLKIILQLYYDANGSFPSGQYATFYDNSSSWANFEAVIGQQLPKDPIAGPANGDSSLPFYAYYGPGLWDGSGGTPGPNNCYHRPIVRIWPGLETKPRILECDPQYNDGADFFLME